MANELQANLQRASTDSRESVALETALKGRGKVGIGLDKKNYRVTAIAPDSPAEVAGIKVGDVLKKIDGKKLPLTYYDTVMRVTGEVGTIVFLGLERDGKEIEIPVKRQ